MLDFFMEYAPWIKQYLLGVVVLIGVIIFDRKEIFKNIEGKRYKIMAGLSIVLFWPIWAIILISGLIGLLLCVCIEWWFADWLTEWRDTDGFD